MASGPNDKLEAMTPTPAPQAMSSRLMTMKFMQRGSASASASSPTASPTTPRFSSGKRRKVSHASSAATDSPATPLYDQRALHAALEEEENKRQVAVEKRAAELGDSRWVLTSNLPSSRATPSSSLNIVQVGFAQIDAPGTEDDGDEEKESKGHFLRFNMQARTTSTSSQPNPEDQDDDDDDDDDNSTSDRESSDSDSDDAKTATKQMKRSASASEPSALRGNGKFVSKPSSTKRDIRTLTSAGKFAEQKSGISVGGRMIPNHPKAAGSTLACHGCSKQGHVRRHCPSRRP